MLLGGVSGFACGGGNSARDDLATQICRLVVLLAALLGRGVCVEPSSAACGRVGSR